ncbi:MAG: translocation/assembly module TamB domain-containing protein [Terracidiphilus sp.]
MSETGQVPPVPPDSPREKQKQPRASRRRYLRRVLWVGSVIALLLVVGLVGLYFWASSSSFENILRNRLIARIDAATGGRAEIASFHLNLLKLQGEAYGFVLHGREAPGEAPYAQLDSLKVDVDVLGFFSPRVLLRDLELERPRIHLIVYADGTTNQPQPRKKTQTHPLNTLFDLQANHVAVNHGVFEYDDRADANDFQNRRIPVDFEANDVSLLLKYMAGNGIGQDSYRLDAGVRDLRLVRGTTAHPDAPPVEGFAQASVDFTRNAVYLRSLQLTAHSKGSADRVLRIAGELDDFARPRWKASAQGELDLKLMEPALGYPFTPEGIAKLKLAAAGQQGEFRIDGTVHADNASYIGTGVVARGVGLDAHVHADSLRLQITGVTARLKAGGQLEGEVLLDHWIPLLAGAPVVQAAEPPKHEKKGRIHEKTTKPVTVKVDTDLHTDGQVKANFRDVTLDTLLDMVSQPPFQRLGLNTRINGLTTATWSNGDVDTLSVAANLNMSPSPQSVAGEAPTSGAIDATYTQRHGAVDLRTLQVNLPASQISAHGQLGAFPMTSPTGIAIEVHSHNLDDFDTLFRDLGVMRAGKSGTSALPVDLDGQADFKGSWAGSLVDPHLAGDLQATNLSVELPASSDTTLPRLVHWDSLDATGSYSASRIAIDRGHLRHGDASIDMNGTLTATEAPSPKSPGKPLFDAHSLLRANVRASAINADDVTPLLTEKLPVTGLLSAQMAVDGPVDMLNGNGWVQLDNGTLYGEPLTTARAEGKIAGQVVQFSSVTMNNAAGAVTGSGSYDLRTRQFQVDAHGTGIDIAKIDRLHTSSNQVTGNLAFSLTGSGTFDDPRINGKATLADLTVSGEHFGEFNAVAHTANQELTWDVTSRLQAAELTAHGQTALRGDNETQATLNFAKFNIGALLEMAHISGLTGESDLDGTVSVQGPLARPSDMRGEARIQDLAVTIAGVHLKSDGALHASMGDSKITLDPLHVTGEETDMRVQGSLSLTGKRQLDLAANGTINLKLAETIDPDLKARGTTTFRVEAHGPLNNPGLSGRIDFQDASLALEDLPNSLSQLHGTLEFNQNRLEVKSLTAMSGGGLLSVSGYLAYQHGIYADLALQGKSIRIRYPQGVSSAADINLQLQGTQSNLLLSGNVMITRFTVSPELDFVALAAQAGKSQPIAPQDAPSNHIRLDVRIQSSPQLNFQNAYAKLAGDVDLRLRGTIAAPSLLGRISITEGSATIAGTRYELQRGEITFTNPVRIEPLIDLNATARVEDYDITLGLHGSVDQMAVTYRSDPPLPEADVVALLALGRTQDQQRLYTQQQEQIATNPATDALLGGALNATVSSRIQKLFGAGSVKVDPNYLGVLGNSTTRITVEEQLGKNLTLTYATDVDTTGQQLLQAEIAINRHVSLLVARDESGVFSMVVKATRRFK